jgi:hypothetical protein
VLLLLLCLGKGDVVGSFGAGIPVTAFFHFFLVGVVDESEIVFHL